MTTRTSKLAVAGLLAFAAAVLALAFVPHAAQAGGTGYEIMADPGTDGGSGNNQDAELLRIGATSDTDNIYFWLKVGDSTSSFDPTVAGVHSLEDLYFPIDITEAHNVQYFADNTWTVGGTWTDNLIWHGNSFGGGTLGRNYDIDWVCNEARFTIPRTDFDVPPVDGDVWPNIMATSWDNSIWDTVAGGPPLDQPPGTGTWTVGEQGFMFQNAPTLLTVRALGDNTVKLTFAAAPDNGAQPLQTFNIYRAVGSGPYTLLDSVPATATTYTDDGSDLAGGLLTGQSYSYRVSGVNCPQLPQQPAALNPGETQLSNIVSLTPDFRPRPVASISADSPTDSSLTVNFQPQTVDCPSTDISCPGADAAASPSEVGAYELWGGPPFNPQLLLTMPVGSCAAACTHLDGGLQPQTTYCYFVIVVDQHTPTPNRSPAGAQACRTTTHVPDPALPDGHDGNPPLSHNDSDLDGVEDGSDSCPDAANYNQVDLDRDGIGDACDLDRDGDGVQDLVDDCPTRADPLQLDENGDGTADACQPAVADGSFLGGTAGDADADGVPDAADNCPGVPNHDQADTDKDLVGDPCDMDADGDGIADSGAPGLLLDNCLAKPNHDQTDTDNDGKGDACDPTPGVKGCVGCAQIAPEAGTSAAAPVRAPARDQLPWVVILGILAGAAVGTLLAVVSLRRRRNE